MNSLYLKMGKTGNAGKREEVMGRSRHARASRQYPVLPYCQKEELHQLAIGKWSKRHERVEIKGDDLRTGA